MQNTLELATSLKDKFEIAFWIVSLLILIVTALAVYFAPLKAVEIGRKLNDQQNQLNAKSELFLTLYSLRGNPTSYKFVDSLNKIDVVFQDNLQVLNAWQTLYDSLNNRGLVEPHKTWDLNRTNLLSEMAVVLGYQKLKQTDIQKNYSPQAHDDQKFEDWNQRQAAKEFFESGTALYKMHIAYFEKTQNNTDKELDT
jgi:hypothetical protein